MGNQPTTPRARKNPGSIVKYRPSPQSTWTKTYGNRVVCRLRDRHTAQPIPITSVSVSVNVIHTLAEITVKQHYQNSTTSPVECVFEFSVGDNAVLASLAVVVDEKKIHAIVQEKEEAFATYDDAISAGAGAYLLETTEKENKYKLSVGNLPATKKAEVHFSYVIPLTTTHDGFLFSIPENLFPKHCSYVSAITGTVDVGEEAQISVLSEHPIKTAVNSFKYTNEEPAFGVASEISFAIKPKSMAPHKDTTDASTQELTRPALVIEHDLRDPTLFTTMLDFRPVFSSNLPEMASDYEFAVIADCSGAMYGSKMTQQINALKLLVHSLPAGCKFNLFSVGHNYSSLWTTSVVLDEDNLNHALWTIDHLDATQGEFRLRHALNSVYTRRDYLRNLCIFVLTSIDYSSESRATINLVAENSARNSRLFAIGFGDEVDTELLNALTFAGRGKAHFVKDDDFVDGILFQQLVAAFAPRVRDIKVTWNVNAEANAKLVDQAPSQVPITASGSSTLVYGLFEVPVPEGVTIPEIEEKVEKVEKSEKSASDQVVAAASSSNVAAKKTGAESSDAVAATPKSARKSKKSVSTKEPAAPAKPALFEGLKYPITSVTVTGLGPDDQKLSWEIPASEAAFRGMSHMIRSTAASKVCKEYLAPKSVRSTLMSPEQVKQKVIEISTAFQVITKYTSYIAVEERVGEATEEAMKQVEIAANDATAPIPPPGPVQVPPITRPYPYRLPPGRYFTPTGRYICRLKQWQPPPPPPVTHIAPPRHLNVYLADQASYTPSFAPSRKKKKEKSDYIASNSKSSFVANDVESTSQLGFALCAHEYDEGEPFGEAPLQALLKQAPPQFKLSAPMHLQSPRLGSVLDQKRTDDPCEEESTKERKRDKKTISPRAAPSDIASGNPQLSHVSLAPAPPAHIGPSAPRAPSGGSSGGPIGGPSPPPVRDPSSKDAALSLGDHESESSDDDMDSMKEAETSYNGARNLKSKKANSRWSDNDMVPNKHSLAYKHLPDVEAPPERHVVSMQPPSDWSFIGQLRASSANSPPHSPHTTTANQLRRIVTAQHANGCWDMDAVALLLHLDSEDLHSANPLSTVKGHKKRPAKVEEPKKAEDIKKGTKKGKKDKEGKTPKSARKGHDKNSEKDAAGPESPRKDADKSNKSDAISAATTSANESSSSLNKSTPDIASHSDAGLDAHKEMLGDVSVDDVWATVILLAYLKLHYDSEKDFWTFVALKVSALLAKAIPDEAARKSLTKKAKSFLESLPVASASPKSPRAASP